MNNTTRYNVYSLRILTLPRRFNALVVEKLILRDTDGYGVTDYIKENGTEMQDWLTRLDYSKLTYKGYPVEMVICKQGGVVNDYHMSIITRKE